jgi:hypothetical protein
MSDPNLNFEQPYPWERYPYRFVWKDKTGKYQSKIVYSDIMKHAREKFMAQFGREMDVDLDRDHVMVDRLGLHDA